MKILVLTAIFGSKDTPKPFPKQSIDCDYICVTEENSPFPLPNLPDRLKAKYYKLQAHWAFPGYDYYVWVDGNIEVTSEFFLDKIINATKDGIAIQAHHERQTIEQEMDFVLNSQNPYLTTRYKGQPLKQEYEYYLSKKMPENTPLFACNIFAWHYYNSNFFNQWWNLVLQWSWFDQSAFSFLYKNDPYCINTVNFGSMLNNPYFKLHSHAQPFG